MASEKAIGNLVVHMGLDDAQMRPTLKNIEQGIKAVDSAWKATYQSQKRVGDDLGAAKTKYDGLNEKLEKQKLLLAQQQDILKQTGTRTKENAFDYDRMTTAIGKSQAKVERFTAQLKAQREQYSFLKTGIPELNKQLKQQQETTQATTRAFEDQGKHIKALEATQKGYKSQMSTLNTIIEKQVGLLHSMNKDSDSDGYHAQQIRIANLRHEMNNLSKSYNMMNGKITHQKEAEQNAGHTIDDLRSKYQKAKETTDVYTSSLVKQGRNYDAIVARQKGLKNQTQILIELVGKEQQKFQGMNKELDSDAYHKQEMHVVQLKDKLRNLNEQLTNTTKNVHKMNVNPFKRIGSGAREAAKSTKEMGITTHKLLFANLASNAISSAWMGITSRIHEATEAGKEYWVEQQKMLAVWTTLTGNASKGKAMVNTINELSVKTGQAVDVVDELEQGFYHLHSSKKEADMLTHAMLNMGDTVGLTSKQLKNVGQDMVHSMAQGHLTTGALNQLAMYFPMVEEKLSEFEAKRNHKTHESSAKMVADLRKMTKAGAVSAADVEKLFDQLGNHKYAKAAENIMQTMFGMQRVIKSRTPALISDIESPFMKVKSPIYAAVAKWASDKRTDREFKKLGNSFALGATTISDAFAKAWHVKNFSKTADAGIDALSKSIERGSRSIAKHAPEITKTLKDLGGGGVDGLKIFGAATKDVAKIMLPFLNIMAKYPKQSGMLVASIWAATKAQRAWQEAMKFKDMASIIIGWAKERLGIKSSTDAIEIQNKELQTNVRLKKEAAAASSGTGISGSVEDSAGGGVGKVAKAEKTAAKVESEASEAGKVGRFSRLASKFKSAGRLGKFAAGSVGILDVLNSATDLIGTNRKNVGSHVGAATGSLGGTAAGAAIGTLIAPGIGTAVGAGLGGMIGEGAGRKFGKAIQRGLGSVPIHVKRMSMTSAYNKLLQEGKNYYSKKKQQEEADVKVLYKNGDITKQEYEKRLNTIKHSQAKINTFTRTNQKGQTAITKAYTQARQKLTESYNKKIMYATNKYGKYSTQVEALENKKKKALAAQRLKYETRVTVKEAKLQTTLTGHIKTAANEQLKIYRNLTNKKKKLSENQMKMMVANSNDERKSIIKNANKEYRKVTDTAKTKRDRVIKAAKDQYSGTSEYAMRQRRKIESHAQKQYQNVVNKAEKQRHDSVSKANSQYKDTLHYAQRQHKGITTQSAEQYKAIKKDNANTKKNYHLTWGGIVNTVGSWIGKMIKGINNNAVKGQNKVFKQYGGSKTLAPIQTVPFATGSGLLKNGLLTKPVLATLNDGNDSPSTNNKEIIAHANGELEQVEGRNTRRYLEKGAGVFNATESKLLSSLGIAHFANGSGLFGFISNIGKAAVGAFKSIYGGLKERLSAIGKFTKNPAETFEGVYPKTVNTSKSKVGTMYSDLFDKTDRKQGKKWWSTAWNVISDAASAGGSGGPVAHTPGAGWHITSGFGNRGAVSGGFSQHDGVDFSGGRVVHALEDAVVTDAGPGRWLGSNGVGEVIGTKGGRLRLIYQELNGKNAHGADLLVHVGDHVKRGQAIAKLGPDGTHVHIGATTEGLWDHGGSSTRGWLDVTKLHGSYGNKAAKNITGGLTKLVTRQLKGSGVLSWVKKFLEPLAEAAESFGGGDSEAPTGSHKHWLKQAGIPASQFGMYNYIISHESSWNPRAHNGSGAYGLPQSLPAGKMASAGSDWRTNPITQLKWMKSYVKKYGGINGAYRFWQAHHWYANGGLSNNEKIAHLSEGNKPEMILPLTNKNRSVELINMAKKMMGVSGNENSAEISALVKLVADLTIKLDMVTKQLSRINKTIENKPVVSDTMVGKMYDNYNSRTQQTKKLVRGEISL